MQLISAVPSSKTSSPLKPSISRHRNAKSNGSGFPADPENPSRIRAVIAQDEPVAREALRSMLKEEHDLDVIGACANGREAVDAINGLQPDAVFLDVELPEINGFDVLTQVQRGHRPAVVFVTANESCAEKAFAVNAVDYLVKPCRRDRLQSALQRLRQRIRQSDTERLHRRIEALLADLQMECNGAERTAIKSNGRIVLVRLADIDWAEAADNYVNLHVGLESHSFRETMNALECRLSPKRFMRISRSTIVNVEQIKELKPLLHGEYAVVLRNGTELTLSRGYREKLRELSWL